MTELTDSQRAVLGPHSLYVAPCGVGELEPEYVTAALAEMADLVLEARRERDKALAGEHEMLIECARMYDERPSRVIQEREEVLMQRDALAQLNTTLKCELAQARRGLAEARLDSKRMDALDGEGTRVVGRRLRAGQQRPLQKRPRPR